MPIHTEQTGKEIHTILFDLDGTILNSGPGVMRCMKMTLEHFGIPEPPEDRLRLCVGPPLSESFGKLYGLPEEKIQEAVNFFRAEYNARGIFECDLYPGIRECLMDLSEQGYLLVITSSKVEKACRRITDHFGITDCFFDIAGSIPEENLEKKVDVINAFFRRHPEQKREDCVLVGDTHFDAEGAAAAGVGFVCVTYGYEDPAVLARIQAIAKPGSAAEIRRLFLSGSSIMGSER